ncbi:MAG TPA: ABC transporter permease subunit [Planctomycetaceae bacterium]|nr:ABC transporter permease subunit [Planctomycetaceae bacterium]
MASPILHRELVSILRTRRMLVFQCLLIFLFAALVIVRWPTEPRVALSGARPQQVFRLFGYGLLTTLLLVLPVFPASNIVREKNRGTLALLLNTPLGAWRIYVGKLMGVLGLAGILLSLSLPAAAACYALGGPSLTGEFPRVYAVLALAAFQYAALGLCISTFSNSIDGAVRITYAFVLMLSVISLGPHQFFQGSEGYLADWSEELRCLSPFSALMSILGAGDLAGKGLMSTTNVPGRFAVLSLVITAVCSVCTVLRLNHRIFDRARPQGRISDDQDLKVRAFRRLMFLVDPQRRARGIGPLVNPVMVKEFRCRRFGRLSWLLRLIAACAVLSLALTYATTMGTLEWDVETIGGIMVFMQVALLVLITPSLAAGLISGERESGGWPLLQMTTLSVPRIVWGKLLSVILTLLLVLCATLPGYLVMVYIKSELRFQVERVVICLAATAVFAMLLSAALGSLFRRTASATAAAYAALLAVCAGPLLIWLGRDAPFGRGAVEWALIVNPVAAALSVIRTQGFQEYDLIPGNWWFLGIASTAALIVLIAQTWRISKPQ